MHISYNDPKKFHTQCRLSKHVGKAAITSEELLVLLCDSSLWPGFLSFPLKKPKRVSLYFVDISISDLSICLN